MKGSFTRTVGIGLLSIALQSWGVSTPGTVTFANASSTVVVNGLTGNPVAAADGVQAALYWSPVGTNHFVQIGSAVPVGVVVPGIFAGGTYATGPGTAGGAVGQFQVRAWGGGFATFEQAMLVPGALTGQSGVIQVATGNPAGVPPTPAGSLGAGGLQGFTLTNETPTITSPPTNQTVAVGGTVNLGVTVGGPAPFGYQWLKDGRVLGGATNSTLTVTNPGVADSGMYQVVVTNANGLAISLPALVAAGNPELFAWGMDNAGQLGDGTTTYTDLPVDVASNVVAASAGADNSLFVKSDGTLWGMGYDGYGQLGNGVENNTNLPIMLTNNVVAVAAGAIHALFVKNDGTLWGMGYNADGELGDGTTNNAGFPVMITSNVVAVAAGQNHSMFIKGDGTLWTMGYNRFGELGNGTTNTAILPVVVASNVVAAAAGGEYSLFLKSDGTLWGMGHNNFGQLGNGTVADTNRPVKVASNVAAMAAGYDHSLSVKSDGTLWAAGNDYYGQLGNGTWTSYNANPTPTNVASNVMSVSAGWGHSIFIKNDGTMWGMGLDGAPYDGIIPTRVPGISPASAVSGCSANHTLAVGLPQLPVIGQPPAGQTVPFGGNAVFTVVAGGFMPLAYQWYFNGTELPGAVGTNYTTGPVTTNNAGNYTVVVTNAYGSVTSRVAVLTVILSPVVTSPPTNQIVELGGTAQFSVLASGVPPMHYQWRKLVPFNPVNLTDGGNVSGSAAANLVLTNVGTNDACLYDVIITNSYGSVTGSVASLTIATRILSLGGNLAFGNVMAGLEAQRTLTITNAGNTPLTVTDIAYPAGFSGGWTGQIPPGSSTNVVVTFAPASVTTYGGKLTVYSDATSGTATRAITGTGTTPAPRVISLGGSLNFGDVPLWETSRRTLTIANLGTSSLTVSGITYPGGFSGNWAGTIQPGGNANVTVGFTPGTLTSYGGSLTVSCDATSGTRTKVVAGVGIAGAPNLAITMAGTNCVITWPTNTAGFVLEYATNYPAAGWTTNAKAPAVATGQYILTNGISGNVRFYRLRN